MISQREVSNDPELVEGQIVAHYKLVAPIMENIFGRIPIVWTTPNPKANQPPIYHGRYFGHYSHLTSEHVQHLVSIGAQEFHSWFPLVDDRRVRGLRASCLNGNGIMQPQRLRATFEPARRYSTSS